MFRLCLISLFVLPLLAACGSSVNPEPIGIGTGVDELKKSPCACVEVPQDYNQWMKKSG